MVAIFLVGVRARKITVAAVANHACFPSSVGVIVPKLTEFKVPTAARINEWVSALFERVCVPGFLGVQRHGRRVRDGRSRDEGRRC